MLFLSFSYLIALATTLSTVRNTSDETGHPSPVPNLGGKAFRFSSLSVMFVVTQFLKLLLKYLIVVNCTQCNICYLNHYKYEVQWY